MRKLLIVITIILLSVAGVSAQNGLNVAPYLSGKFTDNPGVTYVNLSGKQLSAAGLSVYKSISETADDELAADILNAVNKDGASAQTKEVSYKNGQLYFGFYAMGGSENRKRYLFYLNRRAIGKRKSTLIYIEGNLSESEVKALIEN
ncbi:MAG: hypothetical protein K2M01_00835 [Paramuribaculum sp.]|nr:hypothetical protein [Paramuribaculum sp.]